MANSNGLIIIIGCGRLGASLANTLSDRNKNVMVIDSDKDSFRKLSSAYGGLSLVGNAGDIDTLKEANIEKADTVLVVTNNDNTNIMVAQLCKEMFRIKNVIARLYDPERECIYREFHIQTICPALLSAQKILTLMEEDVA